MKIKVQLKFSVLLTRMASTSARASAEPSPQNLNMSVPPCCFLRRAAAGLDEKSIAQRAEKGNTKRKSFPARVTEL